MAGFLYFIECGQGALGPDDAPELRALSDSLASIRIEGLTLGDIDALGTKPGRDLDERVSGLLVASGTFALYQMRMAPSQQAWLDKGTVLVGGVECACWCGVYTDQAPGPRELQRLDMLPGAEIKLGDGNTWRIPQVFRRVDGRPESLVKGAVTVLPDGRMIELKPPRLRALEDRFASLFELVRRIEEEGEEAMTDAVSLELIRAVIDALSINYRINASEIGLLGLISPSQVLPLAMAIVDFELFVALLDDLKKKNSGEYGSRLYAAWRMWERGLIRGEWVPVAWLELAILRERISS